MEPLVSVVISSRNRAEYLKRAIKNILSQSYGSLEIIALDDGSSDNSLAMLHQVATEDKRLRAFRNEQNLGVSDSLNKGIAIAQGTYIAIIDDDDQWID